jgi:hypothetical protein
VLVSALDLSLVAFSFIFGAALLRMLLRAVLPEPHLNTDSRDVVKLGTGLLGSGASGPRIGSSADLQSGEAAGSHLSHR